MGIDWENNTETCDFWIGVFPDEDSFSKYVGERPDYYDYLNDDPASTNAPLKGAPIDQRREPLSKFIGDQGHQWYDHDLIEMGFNAQAKSVAELVDGYSHCDQYVAELTTLANRFGINNANAFLFIRAGEIKNPKTVLTEEFEFQYVGQITYNV